MTTAVRAPRISIVTSSFNQGQFIGRTIDSVLAQHYPNLEHIVVDGMSTDATVDVLSRDPHLTVIREPDQGQADAINKGFRVATGEIFAFLNSDDTLEPGALERVVDAFASGARPQIVMGRCRFIDEDDRFLGVEHPSAFEDHRRVLEIWKGHCLPQPAVFWTRAVWETSGPLRVDEQLMLDYDLFCRFSRRDAFHRIDHVLANYRLHTQSKTTSVSDAERLDQAIQVSRRYWGTPFGWQYWRIRGSHAVFRLNRRARAAEMMRAGRAAVREKRYLPGVSKLVAGAMLAPDVAADVGLPATRPVLRKIRQVVRGRRRGASPHTEAWLGNTNVHGDGWAGPTVIVEIDLAPGQNAIVLEAATPPGRLKRPLHLEAWLDGQALGRQPASPGTEFWVVWRIADVPAGRHELKIAANTYVVPHDQMGNQDHRPLAYRILRLAAATRG